MKPIFLYPRGISGECFQSEFRIVDTLDVKSSDLEPLELVINKDYRNEETLVGRPTFDKITKYEGRLYEKLLLLNLPPEGKLNKEEKNKIIAFISKYGSPIGSISLAGQIEGSQGAEINWLFIPYKIELRQGEGDFFSSFRNFYLDFVDIVQIIKSGNLKLLNNYRGSFDIGLEGNKLILPQYSLNDLNILPKWVSNTCLNLCYLELYELLSSGQRIKTCMYCGNTFESSKSNELRCNNCKKPEIYRKLHYQRNQEKERESAKQRMRRLREKTAKTSK